MSLARVMVFVSLTCSIVSDLQAIAAEPQRYTFTSGDHIITMDVHFSDPYVGRRLSFRNDREPSTPRLWLPSLRNPRRRRRWVG